MPLSASAPPSVSAAKVKMQTQEPIGRQEPQADDPSFSVTIATERNSATDAINELFKSGRLDKDALREVLRDAVSRCAGCVGANCTKCALSGLKNLDIGRIAENLVKDAITKDVASQKQFVLDVFERYRPTESFEAASQQQPNHLNSAQINPENTADLDDFAALASKLKDNLNSERNGHDTNKAPEQSATQEMKPQQANRQVPHETARQDMQEQVVLAKHVEEHLPGKAAEKAGDAERPNERIKRDPERRELNKEDKTKNLQERASDRILDPDDRCQERSIEVERPKALLNISPQAERPENEPGVVNQKVIAEQPEMHKAVDAARAETPIKATVENIAQESKEAKRQEHRPEKPISKPEALPPAEVDVTKVPKAVVASKLDLPTQESKAVSCNKSNDIAARAEPERKLESRIFDRIVRAIDDPQTASKTNTRQAAPSALLSTFGAVNVISTNGHAPHHSHWSTFNGRMETSNNSAAISRPLKSVFSQPARHHSPAESAIHYDRVLNAATITASSRTVSRSPWSPPKIINRRGFSRSVLARAPKHLGTVKRQRPRQETSSVATSVRSSRTGRALFYRHASEVQKGPLQRRDIMKNKLRESKLVGMRVPSARNNNRNSMRVGSLRSTKHIGRPLTISPRLHNNTRRGLALLHRFSALRKLISGNGADTRPHTISRSIRQPGMRHIRRPTTQKPALQRPGKNLQSARARSNPIQWQADLRSRARLQRTTQYSTRRSNKSLRSALKANNTKIFRVVRDARSTRIRQAARSLLSGASRISKAIQIPRLKSQAQLRNLRQSRLMAAEKTSHKGGQATPKLPPLRSRNAERGVGKDYLRVPHKAAGSNQRNQMRIRSRIPSAPNKNMQHHRAVLLARRSQRPALLVSKLSRVSRLILSEISKLGDIRLKSLLLQKVLEQFDQERALGDAERIQHLSDLLNLMRSKRFKSSSDPRLESILRRLKGKTMAAGSNLDDSTQRTNLKGARIMPKSRSQVQSEGPKTSLDIFLERVDDSSSFSAILNKSSIGS